MVFWSLQSCTCAQRAVCSVRLFSLLSYCPFSPLDGVGIPPARELRDHHKELWLKFGREEAATIRNEIHTRIQTANSQKLN